MTAYRDESFFNGGVSMPLAAWRLAKTAARWRK